MKPRSDELSVALEALRNSPIVARAVTMPSLGARASRTASLRGVVFGSAGALAAAWRSGVHRHRGTTEGSQSASKQPDRDRHRSGRARLRSTTAPG